MSSRAVESVGGNELAREEFVRQFRRKPPPPPPPPRDPSYSFDKKTPDQYPNKTKYNPDKGSELGDRLKRTEWYPGSGPKASWTMRAKKTTAKGEIDNSKSSSRSFQDKYESFRK